MYLNCHSTFSLRYGAIKPEELPEMAAQLGIKTLCLTDINNTSAHFDFVRACIKHNITPLLGIEFRAKDYEPLYTGIARNNQGIFELNSFLSRYSISGQPLPHRAPAATMPNCYIVYRYDHHHIDPYDIQENEFIGIRWFEQARLYSSPWRNFPEKLLAWHPVTFTGRKGYQTHKLLRAIDQNTLLSKLDERYIAHYSEQPVKEDYLISKFEEYPFLVSNTRKLIHACAINLPLNEPKNKKHFFKTKEEDRKHLIKLAFDGFKERYGDNPVAFSRLLSELEVISQQNFLAYYLITLDIVNYAKSKGYRHVGRGSGANSIVAYCIHLTDVDPIELDLYFERFINPHRTSPPDFDMDFCWDERDDVYAYIFRRYGKDHVALLATYSTFQYRAIVREVAKVYGLPKADIDVIIDEPHNKEKHHPLAKEIMEYGKALVDFPNHLSIHAGGVLITEEPILQYTALEMMPKGFPIVHFDMHVAEDNGFFKFDILSQRGLGHIKETVKHIERNKGIKINIDQVEVFKKDPNLNQKLADAQTIGCFYIESPAMRGLLSKLKCDNYLVLVAASSVIRPGVAKSGMMREYIYRHHLPKEVVYLHETFREHLGETYGVMVYQEDVIKIAHHFGGLDLGKADVLRRVMSGKSRGHKIEELETEFFANCAKRGYPEPLAKEVWRQIESFAGYSFCKAHSASFAVESYQSLYLKTYYPLEFMVGVINNFGGFYNTELYVHEARMAGAVIEAPCVNNSEYTTTIYGNTIYLGFIHLKDLEREVGESIVAERKRNGPYHSLEDFIARTRIKKEQISILIRINALRFTGKRKQELMWDKNRFQKSPTLVPGARPLFPYSQDDEEHFKLPPLEIDPFEDAHDQIDLLGFPLVSPFSLIATEVKGHIKALEMGKMNGKTVKMVGYYICQKDLRTSDRRPMSFGTWIDEDGHFFDTTHFPPSLAHSPFLGKGCYLITGKIVEDFGFYSMEVEKMVKLKTKMDS